ncbi:2-polyprenylphenol hydroxylase-like oxidoreductase [Mycolicibacterium chubuense NBB4]|uniref:2-polyprenylphenol hydroxylase-like oxidoreductase n=1 Tax=Mycolicibacterium chubuense (strain NBB4) TaxID=710421 RepID=I4BGT5_MYCCN|nr:FAD/NAD(P)-binding protein [Mycolicibacterium chubuense]AFM16492.1 2-polyprenylphenol hydroxylase-like oxidoreductase [Mycolicibacterium chubuense NBB4]
MSDCRFPTTGWTPMTPVPYRVTARTVENRDTATLTLAPVRDALPSPQPGEFMMMYAFGMGEVAISVSGIDDPDGGLLAHTVRSVGGVSRALHDARPGAVLGMRGPFGTGWALDAAAGRDLVVVGGGVGLAPLRSLILAAVADPGRFGRLTVIAGARTRGDFLFRDELSAWQNSGGADVHLTVDVPVQGWPGEVGFVTEPLRRLALAPDRTTAFLCGPEPMMRSCAELLLRKGMASSDIRVSLERNMQCGIGWCGHCQLGPLLLCLDGPVVGYDVASELLRVKEL